MGADNWTECPNCRALAQSDIKVLQQKLVEQYGKIAQADYCGLHNELLHRIKVMQTVRPLQTLRENFTLSTDQDGVLHIDYDSSCEKCRYRVTYKQTFDTFKTQYSKPVYTVDM